LVKPLVIVGAGGHGREALDIVEAMNAVSRTFDFLGFVDDDDRLNRALIERRGASLLGVVDILATTDAEYVIAIGSPQVRRLVDGRITPYGRQAATLIHPDATIASETVIGLGAIVAAGARLTTNIRVGRHFHANQNVTVGHDCVFGDYVSLNPGCNISGNVTLGHDVMIGTGAAIVQGRTVGSGATIGAGAVVVDDIDAHVTAVGIPARPLPKDAA
jgi:sugar O-acyltransferase (sialic acid O-acetyltransferase NeuD family)